MHTFCSVYLHIIIYKYIYYLSTFNIYKYRNYMADRYLTSSVQEDCHSIYTIKYSSLEQDYGYVIFLKFVCIKERKEEIIIIKDFTLSLPIRDRMRSISSATANELFSFSSRASWRCSHSHAPTKHPQTHRFCGPTIVQFTETLLKLALGSDHPRILQQTLRTCF